MYLNSVKAEFEARLPTSKEGNSLSLTLFIDKIQYSEQII